VLIACALPLPTVAQETVADETAELMLRLEESPADSDDSNEISVKPRLTIRGNLFHKTWADSSNRSDAKFDTIILGMDASAGEVFTSSQYRFYDGYSMLHHVYVGFHLGEGSQIQFGVHQKPFGLLPYASHNYFFNLGYYIGLEDDYDLGGKLILDRGETNLQFAYYRRDEGNWDGDSEDSARYSYDIVETDAGELAGVGVTTAQRNQERNQFNARLAYTLTHHETASTEFGISGEWGQIRNTASDRNGDHYAAAAHLNGNYDRWNVQLQGTRFENNLRNPAGEDDRFVVRGAYDAPYKAAAAGWLFIANVAYSLPVETTAFDSITLYTDYSYLLKDEGSYNDSEQLTIGSLFEVGAALIYVDLAFGRNHPFIGPSYSTALAEGDPDDDWELWFNISAGFYF
jgi:hypothetical protein